MSSPKVHRVYHLEHIENGYPCIQDQRQNDFVTPTIHPGRRSVCSQDHQDSASGEVPGDHQGGAGGGVHQGEKAVNISQQSVKYTPSKLCKLVAEPEESPSDKR